MALVKMNKDSKLPEVKPVIVESTIINEKISLDPKLEKLIRYVAGHYETSPDELNEILSIASKDPLSALEAYVSLKLQIDNFNTEPITANADTVAFINKNWICPQDTQHVRKTIEGISLKTEERNKIKKEYEQIFKDSYEKEEKLFDKINKSRIKANNWLIKYSFSLTENKNGPI